MAFKQEDRDKLDALHTHAGLGDDPPPDPPDEPPDEPDPPPEDADEFFRLDDYTVTDDEPRRTEKLQIRGAFDKIEWGYTATGILWPDNTRSLIGSNVRSLRRREKVVFGQEVFKEDNRINIVWSMKPSRPEKRSLQSNLPNSIRWDDGFRVRHVFDAAGGETYAIISNLAGDETRCPGVAPVIDEIVLTGKLEYRLSQFQNHCAPDTHGVVICQERPTPVRYSEIWLALTR